MAFWVLLVSLGYENPKVIKNKYVVEKKNEIIKKIYTQLRT